MTGNKQIKQLSKISILLWILTSCATGGYYGDPLDYSLQDIQKVVSDSLPAPVGYVSSNGREYYSKQYKINVEGGKSPMVVVKIVILGSQRPYNLSAEASVVSQNTNVEPQQAFESGNPYYGEESLSKRIVTKVHAELAKRRKNKNLFDDFRAF